MPASYPGTVKVWSTKVDLVDTVFAAHVNDLQTELSAVETILGLNPQGSVTDVASRLAAIETKYVLAASPGRSESIFGSKTFQSEIAAASGVHATDHMLLTGTTLATRLDNTGVQALNATTNAAVDLPLQPNGGRVMVGGKVVWHSGNDGAGSGLDADTLDGVQGSGYAPISHAHGFTGIWGPGVPGNGYTQIDFGVDIGWVPSYVNCVNQAPIAGVTFAPLLQGCDTFTSTGFQARWINQKDGNPYNSPILFRYEVIR